MGVYKRYDNRPRKSRKFFFLWIGFILLVFALTALFGYLLGKKAAGTPHYTLPAQSEDAGGALLSPAAEQKFHGIFVSAEDLPVFSTEDPDAFATFWLYRDGQACFAAETDRLLGNRLPELPTLDLSGLSFHTSGLFAVRSLTAEEPIREVCTAYERALLSEFAGSGISEIVLCFDKADPDRFAEMLEYAKDLPVRTCICVPYALLHNADGVRCFAAAEAAGCPVVLDAGALTPDALRADLTTYGFYYTRYRVRLLLSGESAALADVLSEATAECWQFCSGIPLPPAETTDAGPAELPG